MSTEEEGSREKQRPYIDDSLLINTRLREVERQQAEDKKYQREYDRKQLRFNGLLTVFTALLFGTSLISDILVWRYVSLTKISSDAAKEAADAAANTLNQMKTGGQETKRQVDRLIAEQKRTADSMEGSTARAKQAMDQSERQSKAALDASISVYRNEQRAWVGVASIETTGGKESQESFFVSSVKVIIRNSGRTPALRMAVDCCIHARRLLSEPIPDYDSAVRENKEFEQKMYAEDRLKIDEIARKDPERAAAMREGMDRWIQEHESLMKTVVHEGAVLAPEVAQPIEIVSRTNWATTTEVEVFPGVKKERQLAVYLVGKITYYDVFSGTPQHTTKFCLVRAIGTSFNICPEGNWME